MSDTPVKCRFNKVRLGLAHKSKTEIRILARKIKYKHSFEPVLSNPHPLSLDKCGLTVGSAKRNVIRIEHICVQTKLVGL